jgi:tetratricopeptide (TPR) repeat protein
MMNFSAQLLRHSIAGVCLFITVGASSAQEGPDAQDLRALRYYIAQNETVSIAAELRRLENAFPDWTAPDDMGALELMAPTTPTTEIDSIFTLIARNDIAAARRELSAARAAFPDWVPPADMLSLLTTANAQTVFDAAIAARDPDAALRVAMDEPTILRCNRINNAWQLAELQKQTGDRAGALSVYRQILRACSSTADVAATIEKADSVANIDELRMLVATAQQQIPGSSTIFGALHDRLLAGRDVAAAATPATPATSAAAATPRPAQQPPASTQAQASAPAIVTRTSAASPLAELRRSGDSRLGQVRASSQIGDFRTCTARSVSPRSLEVAYERAWCVFNLDRPLEALALFTAVAGGLSGTVSRDARYGMALSMLQRNMTNAASQIAAQTDFTIDQRRTIESTILDQRGVRAYQVGNYSQAIIYFDGLEAQVGTLRRDLSIMRAYAYLNSGDRATARTLFMRLNNTLATDETRTGLAAAGG